VVTPIAKILHVPRVTRLLLSGIALGVSLLPRAGVAMGMALVGAHAYPQHANVLLSVAIAATVIFEVTGPVFINLALDRVDERP